MDITSSRAYPWLMMLLVAFSSILTVFASTAVAVMNPVLIGDFALSLNQSIWISTAYLVMVASIVPCSIFLAEKLGYKETYPLGLAIIIVCGTAMGFCTNFYVFLTYRILSGIGVGLLFPISVAMLTMLFKEKDLNLAVAAYTTITFGGGTIFGFLYGGYVAQYSLWPEIFYVNSYLGIPCFILLWKYLKMDRDKLEGKFDRFGYLLFVLFIVSAVVVLACAKGYWNTEGWRSPFIIFFIILGISSFILFVIEECKKKNPLFFLQLFKIHTFSLGCLLIFFVGGMYFSNISLFSIALVNYMQYSKIQSALHMLTYGASFGLFGSIAGIAASKIDVRIIILVGCFFLASDCFLQHSLSIYSDHFDILFLLFVRGASVGILLGPVTSWTISDVPDPYKSNAMIIATIFRQVGGGLLGSWIQLITYVRNIYHFERFTEGFVFSKIGLNVAENKIIKQLYLNSGANVDTLKKQVKQELIKILNRQSELLAFNDAFFLIGIIISIFMVFIAISIVYSFFRNQKNTSIQSIIKNEASNK